MPTVLHNQLNFQTSRIYEYNGQLYVEMIVTSGYTRNAYNIYDIHIQLLDRNGILFADAYFASMDGAVIGYGQSIRWTFKFPSDTYNLYGCDISSLRTICYSRNFS